VPFAQAIERKLADLESRLLVPIRFALAKVNEAINWINRIVDLDGLFQRLTLIESAVALQRRSLERASRASADGRVSGDNAQAGSRQSSRSTAHELADQVA
jgi:hypothetical protein